jgi:DNA-binding IclR family transcriptional regulator
MAIIARHGEPESPMPSKKLPSPPKAAEPARAARVPQNHRTVDRVTHILEEVVYKPGMTFAELARALDAPKSSVHGFLSGLLAKGWLYEANRRYYLGPAVYGLTMASGHIRAGLVTQADLQRLSDEAKFTVFLGVQAGDHLIYVAEAGTDDVAGYEARSNIRRTLLVTAGGKALLAGRPAVDREGYLRRRTPAESEHVEMFLHELPEIQRTRVAKNLRLSGTRFAIGTAVRNRAGEAVAAITLVGPTNEVQPRVARLSKILLRHVDTWAERSITPREAI